MPCPWFPITLRGDLPGVRTMNALDEVARDSRKKILILGAGRIGRALKAHLGSISGIADILIADAVADHPGVLPLTVCDDPFRLSRDIVSAVAGEPDAVVNALPFDRNVVVANACAMMGAAYFDFSEDVESSRHIQELAAAFPNVTFVPQCGLAPGASNIIAAGLLKEFREPVRSLSIRVGALPQSANNSFGYDLSWSARGLVNEYLRACDVIWNGNRMSVPPLSGTEKVVLDGVVYEAFYTSGGIATMCETLEGRIENLTYKTLRYPGHVERIKFLLDDLNLKGDPALVERIFTNGVPVTMADKVVISIDVIGQHRDGRGLVRKTVDLVIEPGHVDGVRYSAIQMATAGGMAGVVELWAKQGFGRGYIRQEALDLDALCGTFGFGVYARELRRRDAGEGPR
jgi:saccharopine dehydrogenase-like NADP-dependent oxidoreductase